ncbi:MAG TPA: ABC transporter ATP-binding protein [Patescibacteria group bacterium]|jgi:ABC-2 type transport system ATP-binding protein
MDALEIKKLRKTYRSQKGQKETVALRGIDLNIKQGDFYGLLGPNGAGKSTTIHCMSGLTIPTKGTIKVFGDDAVADPTVARQHVGLSPQEVMSLDWFLSVEETLDYHGGYYGMPKKLRKKRIEELLDAFSLQDKRKQNPRGLSGGMRRRLVIARALMHDPQMLVLDEPTAGVDVELRLELWHYMKKVNKEGKTILLTTHYIEEAEQLCNQIALINHGKIVETGTVAELKKKFKKKTLEDVYLSVVGREELQRTAEADEEGQETP